VGGRVAGEFFPARGGRRDGGRQEKKNASAQLQVGVGLAGEAEKREKTKKKLLLFFVRPGLLNALGFFGQIKMGHFRFDGNDKKKKKHQNQKKTPKKKVFSRAGFLSFGWRYALIHRIRGGQLTPGFIPASPNKTRLVAHFSLKNPPTGRVFTLGGMGAPPAGGATFFSSLVGKTHTGGRAG